MNIVAKKTCIPTPPPTSYGDLFKNIFKFFFLAWPEDVVALKFFLYNSKVKCQNSVKTLDSTIYRKRPLGFRRKMSIYSIDSTEGCMRRSTSACGIC